MIFPLRHLVTIFTVDVSNSSENQITKNNKNNSILLFVAESNNVYIHIQQFINHGQRNPCLCELLQWGSRQRAALYHSQPPVGFCPWLSHTTHSQSVSPSTVDRSPSAGLRAGPSLWADCCKIHKEEFGQAHSQRLTTNANLPLPWKHTPYVNKAAHIFTASLVRKLWIWITLWPRLK